MKSTAKNILFISLMLIMRALPLTAQGNIVALIPEFKINPMTGELVGDGEKLGTLQKRFNLLNEQNAMQLYAVGGETAAFQLILPADEALRLIPLADKSIDFRIYQVGSVRGPETKEGQALPDILLPLKANADGEYAPRRNSDLMPANSRYFLFWVELITSPLNSDQTLPVTLKIRGNDGVQELLINLTVDAEKLPPAPLMTDFNEYGDKYLQVFRKNSSPAELHQVEASVFQLAAEHNGSMNPLPYKSQQGKPRDGMVPVMLNNDSLNPQLDWREYDARFGKFLDGSAFPDGQPIDHLYLPFNPYWPADFRLYVSDRERYEAIWMAMAKAFIEHFREKGWTETTFQVYCNQKPNKGGGVPWHLDEPKSVKDYEGLRYYHDLAKRAFAGAEGLKIRFRIDISHFYCNQHKGRRDKDFRVNGGGEILAPVDIWVISRHSMYDAAAIKQAKKLQAQGKEIWIYAETPKLKESGQRSIQRIYHSWKHQFDGVLIWRSFARKLHKRKGSEYILYAVDSAGEKGVYPSIRLKQFKRAFEDVRLFELAIEKGHLNREAVQEIAEKYANSNLDGIWQYRTTLHKILLEDQKIGKN